MRAFCLETKMLSVLQGNLKLLAHCTAHFVDSLHHHPLSRRQEEFEDTKGVIRIHRSKEDRQHNGQKKKQLLIRVITKLPRTILQRESQNS